MITTQSQCSCSLVPSYYTIQQCYTHQLVFRLITLTSYTTLLDRTRMRTSTWPVHSDNSKRDHLPEENKRPEQLCGAGCTNKHGGAKINNITKSVFIAFSFCFFPWQFRPTRIDSTGLFRPGCSFRPRRKLHNKLYPSTTIGEHNINICMYSTSFFS